MLCSGKSSFIRAIAGLWEVGDGAVTWFSDPEISAPALVGNGSALVQGPPPGVFFLPQKPYNFLGTLRQQIQYPSIPPPTPAAAAAPASGAQSDTDLLQLLVRVRLGDLALRVGGLDTVLDWSNVLSLGEQQRLAFARVLHSRPSTVVLDEATSALDLPTEEAMYGLLQDMEVSYLSVGHRPSLLRYHDSKLVLSGPGREARLTPVTVSTETVKDLTEI